MKSTFVGGDDLLLVISFRKDSGNITMAKRLISKQKEITLDPQNLSKSHVW